MASPCILAAAPTCPQIPSSVFIKLILEAFGGKPSPMDIPVPDHWLLPLAINYSLHGHVHKFPAAYFWPNFEGTGGKSFLMYIVVLGYWPVAPAIGYS